jgi:hypothetical protein
LWLVDTRDDAAVQITASPEMLSAPSVSPDGRRIVLTTGQTDFDLVEIPKDGGPIRDVLATSAEEQAGIWIPGTRKFLYMTGRTGRREIRERDTAGGYDRAVVTAEPGVDNVGGAAPSPDGQYVAYFQRPNASIWIKPLAGGPARRLTQDDVTEMAVAWSPDSNRVATYRRQDDQWFLRLTSLGGDGLTEDLPFTGEPNGEPEWSPDGLTIALPAQNGVVLLKPGGAPQRTLFQEARSVRAVQWSAEGDTIYLPWATTEADGLAAVDVETDTWRVVATLPPGVIIGTAGNPTQRLSWNAEGTELLTTVVRDRNTDLWILEGFRPPATGWRRWFR